MQKYQLPGGQANPAPHYDWKQDRLLLFGLVGAALLTVGAFATGIPIGFYTFERWYVCLVAVLIAYSEERRQRPLRTLIAMVAAIIVNPFVPLYLTRAIWQPIDLVTSAWLAWIAVARLLRRLPRSVLIGAPVVVGVSALVGVAALRAMASAEAAAIYANTVTIEDTAALDDFSTPARGYDDLPMAPPAVQGDPYAEIPRTGPPARVEKSADVAQVDSPDDVDDSDNGNGQ